MTKRKPEIPPTDEKLPSEQITETCNSTQKALIDTIYMLALAAEYRDIGAGIHTRRMSHFAVAMARRLKLDEDTIENIFYAAPLHDVGKIGIPDELLMKPSKLSPAEWEIMKHHSAIGAKMLEISDAAFMKLAQLIALTHHEKWDGSGYPSGLKGESIPIAGRITAVIDVFDALISERPYKRPMPVENALSVIRDGSGSYFDPKVVEAFFSIKDEILSIKRKFDHNSKGEWLPAKLEKIRRQG
ncbi:MAG: HD domain-containing protein [Dehalococcoidia bacterium]|nr:MAG: HD domain-containing protein [Dehalococcoidia bacterium]